MCPTRRQVDDHRRRRPPARRTPASTVPPAVELTGITKRFPGVVANSDINISVRRGTVHALVGENGAGKSTLMKTLYGMHQPDEGTIAVDGAPGDLPLARPTRSRAGIGMVHQHFMLADNLTVWENIVLGAEPTSRRPARRREAPRAGSTSWPRRYGLMVDSGALVEDLGVGAPAAGGDPQGALPRRQDPDPGRADRRAGAAGGRRAVRQPARAQGRGPDDHLHLAQARRGARHRRRDHRHPRAAPPSAPPIRRRSPTGSSPK